MASKYLSFIHSHKCLPIRTKQFAVSRQWTGCMVVYENHLWKCAKMLWISLQESDSLSSFIGQEPKASNTFISNWLWWQSVPKTDLLVKSQDFHLIRDTCGVAGGGCGGGVVYRNITQTFCKKPFKQLQKKGHDESLSFWKNPQKSPPVPLLKCLLF